MNFDSLAIAAIASELEATLLEGRVQRVVQINSLSFSWEIFVHPTRYYLTISVEPQTPHIYLTEHKTRRGSGNETPLMLVIRKYMRGARLRAIEQPPYERLLYLHFESYLGPTTLVIEFLGPRSNLMLLEADQTILGVARLSKANSRQQRVYLPGQLYAPPPTQAKLEPPQLTEVTLRQELAEASPEFKVVRLLPEIVRGVSPQMAREIVYRATGEVDMLVRDLTDVSTLVASFHAFFAQVGQWQPTLALAEDDTPIALAPYSLQQYPKTKSMPTFSEAVETYLAESAAAYAAARVPLLEAIADERRRLARRRERLQEDAAGRANPELYREKGEAILAQAHQIQAGQTKLIVSWYPDQPSLQITLDPDLSASDNAQNYFKQYRKSQRSEDEIPAQLEKITLDEQYLDQLEQDILMAEDRSDIDAVGVVLAEAGYYQPRSQAKKGTKKVITRYLRLQAPDGAAVWVGKNALQNAHLTFSKATADDMWLHARGVPGAHVVIPTTEGLPSEEDVLWAASVAAHYSRARHDTKVEVDVTLKKYVRAIKGAAPGLVMYRNESTLRVAPQLPEVES